MAGVVDYKDLKNNGFMQQKQEGCFSMRLQSVGGHFTAAQLGAVQRVAEQYGAGYIHLTSRQGIEIPFIKLEDIEAVKAALAEGGAAVGVCGPRLRTITACQGSAVCRSGLIDTARLAGEFERRYGGRHLPHKFKIGFTGCRNNCLKTEENDLGIKGAMVPRWQQEKCVYCGKCAAACKSGAIEVDRKEKALRYHEEKCVQCGRCVKGCPVAAWQGRAGFYITFGGLYGNRIAIGRHFLPIVFEEEKLYEIVEAAFSYFAAHAKPGERLRTMLDRLGWEEFQQEVEAVL